jgi:hypothetical protein
MELLSNQDRIFPSTPLLQCLTLIFTVWAPLGVLAQTVEAPAETKSLVVNGFEKSDDNTKSPVGLFRTTRRYQDKKLPPQATHIPPDTTNLLRYEQAASPTNPPKKRVAVGVSLGFANTVNSDLSNTLLVGPLFRFRPKSGWGFEGAGEWFATTIRKSPVGESWPDTRLQVRPIMGGVAYNVLRERLLMAFSVTGGLSFNGLNVDTECVCENKAIDVNKSLIGRAGVSIWYDITSRMSFNIVGGYIVNRPEVTFSSNGITRKAVISGDTAVVSAGIAFWIF